MRRLNSVDLPDVRPAHDGDREDLLGVGLGLGLDLGELGQEGHEVVEHVAGAAAVQRADRVGVAEAEAHELPGRRVAVGVVDLVGDEQDRSAVAAQQVGDAAVLLGDADGDVDDEEDDVGLEDRLLALGRHLGVEGVAAGHPAAGVDEPELAALPLGRDLLAVAGDAGLLLHDRLTATDDAVEEGGLADVGTPHDGHDREVGHLGGVGRRVGVGGGHRSSRAARGRCRRWPRPRPVGAVPRAWCRRGTDPATGRRRAAGSGGRGARRPGPG